VDKSGSNAADTIPKELEVADGAVNKAAALNTTGINNNLSALKAL
jgi:hypothetical protein